MKDLVIDGIEISTDDQGRFSINDLHRASGGRNKDKPSLFYRSSGFNGVVDVLKAQNRAFDPILKKKGRYGGGTWVCMELVYKYAMWINPEFEVKVIQTFANLSKKNKPTDAMVALNELTAKIEGNANVASICGRELAKYKRIKRENEIAFDAEVSKVQLTLGFKRGE